MLAKVVAWLKRKRQERLDALMFERQTVVSCDNEAVSVVSPDCERQNIDWDEIFCIAIETNDSGPWSADVWWLLEGEDKRVTYPQGATGDPEMLQQLSSRFQGFSDEAVIKAMGCTSNSRFVCWERKRL